MVKAVSDAIFPSESKIDPANPRMKSFGLKMMVSVYHRIIATTKTAELTIKIEHIMRF